MDPIYAQEIKLISLIQSIGEWFTPFALFFSLVGSELFYIFLAPLIYWCYDPKLGIRGALYLSISGGVNTLLKVFFHSPRPYWYSTEIKALSAESTFGEPSGHAQSSAVVWGTIALWFKRRWVWILAITMIFFVSLSRVYLAVHFPSDIVLGWIVAIVLLWVLSRTEGPFLNWFRKRKLFAQIVIIFLISLGFIGLFILISITNGSEVVLQSWIDTAAAGRPEALPIDPLSVSKIVSYAGLLLGTALGALWMDKSGGFSTKDTPNRLALRFLVGLMGVIILWAGLGALFPFGKELIPITMFYIRFALIALWITGAAPVVFIKLGLARTGFD